MYNYTRSIFANVYLCARPVEFCSNAELTKV